MGILARAHRARWRSRATGGGTEAPLLAAAASLAAIIALAALVAPRYLNVFRAELSRSDGLERASRSLGLSFTRDDPAFPGSTATRYPFELLSRGTRQECENVFSGAVDGVSLIGFDLSYVEEAESEIAQPPPRDRATGAPRRVTCAIAQMPAASFAHVVIAPVGAVDNAVDAATWAAWGVRNRPIQFESREFDGRFRVRAEDPKFASAVIDPRLISWLLANGDGWVWELQREFVLCTRGLVPPREIPAMISTLIAFTRHIPSVAVSF